MSKKRKKSVPVPQPKQEKKMVINMNEMNLKKQHMTAGFRTGKFMTEKDRPRKKDWKREYERGKGSGKYGEYGTGPFLVLCPKQGEARGAYAKKTRRKSFKACWNRVRS